MAAVAPPWAGYHSGLSLAGASAAVDRDVVPRRRLPGYAESCPEARLTFAGLTFGREVGDRLAEVGRAWAAFAVVEGRLGSVRPAGLNRPGPKARIGCCLVDQWL